LPTLQAVLAAPQTVWSALALPWYNGQTRSMEIVSETAVWYHAGKPPVPIRWVIVRDPASEYAPVALLSTNTNLAPSQIVTWFVWRWCMEVTFEEGRTREPDSQVWLFLERQRWDVALDHRV